MPLPNRFETLPPEGNDTLEYCIAGAPSLMTGFMDGMKLRAISRDKIRRLCYVVV
jgi:hypothetical protein